MVHNRKKDWRRNVERDKVLIDLEGVYERGLDHEGNQETLSRI